MYGRHLQYKKSKSPDVDHGIRLKCIACDPCVLKN